MKTKEGATEGRGNPSTNWKGWRVKSANGIQIPIGTRRNIVLFNFRIQIFTPYFFASFKTCQ
jgi:hypothetical protein